MESRYNIYFSGQLLDGQDSATVRANMARLFKAGDATLDKLFSGSEQLVKRDCDKATALQYKQAIEKAGGVAVVRRAGQTPPATASAAAEKPMTAAEKIASLAAAADLAAAPQAETGTADAAPATDSSIGLAPAGTEVLRAGERARPVTSTVNTPELDVDTSGDRLSEVPPAPPAAPDTSHLSTAALGELLPNLPSSAPVLDPDTSGLSLSPDGTDFSDCAAPAAAAPELDLSAIDLAPAGADVLEPEYRRKQDTPPPATDHLTLED